MSDVTKSSTQPLAELRSLLVSAREARDPDQVRAALVAAVSGLLNHVERQSAQIDNLRSDLAHKQGIVTRIGGGDFPSDQDNRHPGALD